MLPEKRNAKMQTPNYPQSVRDCGYLSSVNKHNANKVGVYGIELKHLDLDLESRSTLVNFGTAQP